MNIVVLIRQTPDTEAKIKIGTESNKIDHSGITWIINPYDEFAIEKALKIKEQVGSGEVVLLACGPSRTEEAVRQGLAMGADRAVFIKDDLLEDSDPLLISKLLAIELKNMTFDLILSGKKVIDLETAQIPIAAASELNLPFVSFVMKILEVNKNLLTVEREVDGAKEIIEVNLPALITCDRGDDIPRYASITGIMKAKKKEIKEIKPDIETLSSYNKITIESLELPQPRQESKIFDGEADEKVKKLIKALREESKVI